MPLACSLYAYARFLPLGNVLALRGQLSIPLGKEEISHEDLIRLLGDCLLEQLQSPLGSRLAESTDVFDLIPTLQGGLDINLKFDSPFSFEPSPGLKLFEIFGIRLCHGWTVDPQDKETYQIIVNEKGTYNQVMEALVEGDIAGIQSQESADCSEEEKRKREKVLHQGTWLKRA